MKWLKGEGENRCCCCWIYVGREMRVTVHHGVPFFRATHVNLSKQSPLRYTMADNLDNRQPYTPVKNARWQLYHNCFSLRSSASVNPPPVLLPNAAYGLDLVLDLVFPVTYNYLFSTLTTATNLSAARNFWETPFLRECHHNCHYFFLRSKEREKRR